MAQRMESVAPPGGVMLSASTARLVDGSGSGRTGDGSDQGCRGTGGRPSAVGHRRTASAVGRAESNLVGRRWEMSAVEGLLDRASTATARWSAWWVRRASAKAVWCARCGDGASPWCRGVHRLLRVAHQPGPFRAVARLLRAATGVEGLDGQAARDRMRDRIPTQTRGLAAV